MYRRTFSLFALLTLRAIEYLREHDRDALPDKIVLTFIGFEQIFYGHGRNPYSQFEKSIDILLPSAYDNSDE